MIIGIHDQIKLSDPSSLANVMQLEIDGYGSATLADHTMTTTGRKLGRLGAPQLSHRGCAQQTLESDSVGS
jgi:hypothetical protein